VLLAVELVVDEVVLVEDEVDVGLEEALLVGDEMAEGVEEAARLEEAVAVGLTVCESEAAAEPEAVGEGEAELGGAAQPALWMSTRPSLPLPLPTLDHVLLERSRLLAPAASQPRELPDAAAHSALKAPRGVRLAVHEVPPPPASMLSDTHRLRALSQPIAVGQGPPAHQPPPPPPRRS